MLKVVSGELPKYPYNPKKYVKSQLHSQNARAHSVLSLKKNKIQINQRLQPGEYKSNLAKQRADELKRIEETENLAKEKRDIDRIKRSFLLKKKLAQSSQGLLDGASSHSRGAKSEKKGGARGL